MVASMYQMNCISKTLCHSSICVFPFTNYFGLAKYFRYAKCFRYAKSYSLVPPYKIDSKCNLSCFFPYKKHKLFSSAVTTKTHNTSSPGKHQRGGIKIKPCMLFLALYLQCLRIATACMELFLILEPHLLL